MTEQNEKLENFFNHSFNAFLKAMPEIPAMMGLGDISNFKGIKGDFADYSDQGYENRISEIERMSNFLHSFDRERMTPEQQLSYDVYDFFLDYNCFDNQVGVKGKDYVHHCYPVKHKDGIQSEIINLMTSFHDIKDNEDAKTYLSRLSKIKIVFSQLEEGLASRIKKGIVIPRVGASIVVNELKGFLETPVHESKLLVSFQEKIDALENFDPAEKKVFLEKAVDIISTDIYPAHAKLLGAIVDQLPKCPEQPGIWQLPDGDGYYDYLVQMHTTTTLSVDEIHALGHEEINKLHHELEQGLGNLSLTGKPIGELFDDLRHDSKYLFPKGEAGRKQILAHYNHLMDDIQEKLPDIFDVYPKSKCCITPCPDYLESKRTTMYFPPSNDGTRPGLFELNLGQELGKAKWEMPVLVYHEAYPGHHLQLTIAQELEGLPLFRKTAVNTAYIEGWAKYAEGLAWRFGFNKDPLYELGRKRAELFSSVNLALDTGIHRFRWTRDKGIRFFMENAFVDSSFAEYIVDRITVTPGQTVAYKIGLLKINELYDRMQTALGADFMIKKFHNLILEQGSLPLVLLESIVNQAIQKQKMM